MLHLFICPYVSKVSIAFELIPPSRKLDSAGEKIVSKYIPNGMDHILEGKIYKNRDAKSGHCMVADILSKAQAQAKKMFVL